MFEPTAHSSPIQTTPLAQLDPAPDNLPSSPSSSVIAQSQQEAFRAAWSPGRLVPLNQSDVPVIAQNTPSNLVPNAGMPDAVVTGIALEKANIATPSGAPRARYRSPLRRIVQDTGRALLHDVPEGIADALPWVGRDRKEAPFDEVLARVADDLSRASASDPAWASSVQREVRALSQQLDRLPAPPPLTSGAVADFNNSTDFERPFRPRPIWPGSNGRPEPQMRPVTITTQTGTHSGPEDGGFHGQFQPDPSDSVTTIPPRTVSSTTRRSRP